MSHSVILGYATVGIGLMIAGPLYMLAGNIKRGLNLFLLGTAIMGAGFMTGILPEVEL